MQQVETVCIFDHPVDRVQAAIGHLRGGRPGAAPGPGQALFNFGFEDARLPIRLAMVEVIVKQERQGRTIVSMIMRYQPKYGVIGRVVSWLIMEAIIRGMLCRVLSALSWHLRAEAEAELGAASVQQQTSRHELPAEVDAP